MTWRAYVKTEPYSGEAVLHVWRRRLDDVDHVQAFTIKTIQANMVVSERDGALVASIEEVDEFLRAITTAGWQRGIRPEGFEDHTNELKAVRFHLEDMRKLAKVIPKGG